MATSTIPALKAALRARLAAEAGLAGVQLAYGHPYPYAPADEMVYLGNTQAADPTGGGQFGGGQTSAAMGMQRREERYTLEVFATRRDNIRQDQQVVTERAFAIAAVVEQSIRSWGSETPAFSGIVRWVLVTAVDHIETLADDPGAPPQAARTYRFADVKIILACAVRI